MVISKLDQTRPFEWPLYSPHANMLVKAFSSCIVDSIMLALTAALILGSGDVYLQFAKAFSQRRSDESQAKPDPAIERAMDLMIEAQRKTPKADLGERFRKAIHAAPDGMDASPLPTDYASLDVGGQRVGGVTFVTARMGAVTRTRAHRADGSSVRLPAEFLWNCPWDVRFRLLPSGMIFTDEWQIEDAGGHEGIRAVWLRTHGSSAKIVGTFAGDTTLDDGEAVLHGNTIQITTIDAPEALSVTGSTSVFERKTTFDCSGRRPIRVRVALEQLELRAIDRAFVLARHAKHPTASQNLLRSHWPEPDDLDDSKIHTGARVVDASGLRFRLRHRKIGLPVVVSVSRIR